VSIRVNSWQKIANNTQSEYYLPTDYRFTGQRREGTIGLYDYGARFYDPLLGRFISADTVVPEPGNPQALNRYAYVMNNPLGHTDPTGYLPESSVQGEPSRKKDKYAPFFQEYPYARELYKQILKLEAEGITPYAEGEEWVGHQYSSREEFQRNDKRLMLGSAQREFTALWNKYGVVSANDPDDVPKDIYDAALTTQPFAAAGPLAGAVPRLSGGGYADAWSKATFSSSEKCAQWHYAKHGAPWNSIEEYTQAAMQFYADNVDLARPHRLLTGEMEVKISTSAYFGIYTTDGRIISFGAQR